MFSSQVFLLTVLFGLFHGVVFFPVILSLFGPSQDEDEVEEVVHQTEPKIEVISVFKSMTLHSIWVT